MDINSIGEKISEKYFAYYHKKMDSRDLEELLKISHIKEYRQNELICHIDEELHYVGLIMEGIVRSYYIDANGNEKTHFFHTEIYTIMDDGLFGAKKSSRMYQPLSNVTAILFKIDDILTLIHENETFKEIYITSMENAMRYRLQRERDFLTKSATERYLEFIHDYPDFINKIKQSYIASYLGISPVSLSRIKGELHDRENHLEEETS